MARPSKYNWKDIKVAYEGGLNIDKIASKFKVSMKHLKDKARAESWVINSSIVDEVDEFIAKGEKLAINYQSHEEINALVVEKISTQLSDNGLIKNNRTMLKAVHGVLQDAFNNDEVSISNVKNVTGAIKDIESIANPITTTQQINLNTQNNQVQNNEINSQIVKETLEEFDNEY